MTSNESYVKAANQFASRAVDMTQATILASKFPAQAEMIVEKARQFYITVFDAFEAGVRWQQSKNREEQLMLLQGRRGFVRAEEGDSREPN